MRNFVAEVVARPESITRYSLGDWDLLIRQGRHANLLARIYVLLEGGGLLIQVPEAPLRHLRSAVTQTNRHAELVGYETNQIHKTLSQLKTPIVLLKGAAYVAAGLPPARGRIFTDIDLMVAKSDIDLAEEAMKDAGWVTSHLNDYDQKYYRKWMHELPPMMHPRRKTVVDIHHAILPETARLKPDPAKLFASAIKLEGYDYLYVLCPEDMVLHSAVHLFHDGEFEHALRDLADIDSLLRHFSGETKFLNRLLDRAVELDLSRPLFYALHFCQEILQTPIPVEVLSTAKNNAKLSDLGWRFIHSLLERGLRPDHATCDDRLSGISRWMLYVRSHYLRMPAHLLLPHLFQKALITPWQENRAAKNRREVPTIQQLLARRKDRL